MTRFRDGSTFDVPPPTMDRSMNDAGDAPFVIWRFNHRCRSIPAGKKLRIEALAPAMVHWTDDEWIHVHDTETIDTGLGVHVVDLPTEGLRAGLKLIFTFYWPEAMTWERADFEVHIE